MRCARGAAGIQKDEWGTEIPRLGIPGSELSSTETTDTGYEAAAHRSDHRCRVHTRDARTEQPSDHAAEDHRTRPKVKRTPPQLRSIHTASQTPHRRRHPDRTTRADNGWESVRRYSKIPAGNSNTAESDPRSHNQSSMTNSPSSRNADSGTVRRCTRSGKPAQPESKLLRWIGQTF